MQVIYVAGKYSADSEWEKWQNIQHASEIARQLWLKGWAVICPHRNTMFMGTDKADDCKLWLDGDMEILKRCDAIYMLMGWDDSVGACEEISHAIRNDLLVYLEPELL